MNHTNRVPANQKMLAVPLNDGSTWTGTEAQLRREHPDWIPYAQRIQPRGPVRSTTRADWQNSTSTVLRDENGRVTVLNDLDSDEEDEQWPGRLPSSSVRWQSLPGSGNAQYEFHPNQTIRRRAHAPTPTSGTRGTEDVPAAKPKRQRRGFFAHPLLYLGVGMIAMLTLWVFGQMAVTAWQLHPSRSRAGEC